MNMSRVTCRVQVPRRRVVCRLTLSIDCILYDLVLFLLSFENTLNLPPPEFICNMAAKDAKSDAAMRKLEEYIEK